MARSTWTNSSAALGRLNLDLSERDVKAVFRAVDKDGSGEIDLDEFFNCFRTDSFARDTFFWSSTRPKGMLTHDERIKTQNRLNGNTLQREYTPEEILGTIQSKVQQLNAKTVFNTLDDNRSGRVNVRELVGALGEVCARNTHPPTHHHNSPSPTSPTHSLPLPLQMEIHITDQKAKEIMKEINARVGDDNDTHLTYRSFANTFFSGAHEGTTGDDAGVIPGVKHSDIWRPEGPKRGGAGDMGGPVTWKPRRPLKEAHDYRAAATRDDEMDSIQRHGRPSRP